MKSKASMSYRNLQVNAKTIQNHCQTQRKVIKVYKNTESININKKNPNISAQKYSSTKNHLPNHKPQKYIKNSLKDKSTKSLFEAKINPNDRQFLKNDIQSLEKFNQIHFIPKLQVNKLKIKKHVQVKNKKNTQIIKLKQKVGKFFFISPKNKLNNEINSITYRKNQTPFPQGSEKPTKSWHLQSINFQELNVFKDSNIEYKKEQKKNFISIKMLKNFKESKNQKGKKRKRIASCKFVVNPFKNIQNQSLIKFEKFKQKQDFGDKYFANKIGINEISKIEEMVFTQDLDKENMNISILDLINW